MPILILLTRVKKKLKKYQNKKPKATEILQINQISLQIKQKNKEKMSVKRKADAQIPAEESDVLQIRPLLVKIHPFFPSD